ncbi:hypothetical protein [Candidatus Tokpelaia sp.]|uniref:hypothetical protein n=1 Tax=Candidatus Tokpelaia sp. TaxID=2233777 RepID=UPI00123B974B|nr:hypothetical protein [Candidatus Tokpelaia sp.]KAA6405106.1 hypothetical protein DPQ22_05985 [Candidatus Tokpelaia sp.]
MKTGKGLHQSLLKVADDLLQMNKRRPQEAHLRRAVSSVYYALFHFLAQLCADSFIGTQGAKNRSNQAWRQVYRSLEHGPARKACEQCQGKTFPEEIRNYAALFVEYQQKRHDADYDPHANTTRKDFTKEEIISMIEQAKQAIQEMKALSSSDLRAFSAFVLLKPPRR